MQYITDVVIIGGGPIGLFGVFQAGMLGMKVHLFDALPHLGGQCTALYPQKPIYDVPGHPKILAKDLIDNLLAQAQPFGPTYHTGDQVLALEKVEGDFWRVRSQSGCTVDARAIVIAGGNGAFGPNRPPFEGLEEFESTGSVLYNLNNFEQLYDKIVVIAGGGDSAADWTNLIANKAKKVYLVHRREVFGCMPDSLKKIKQLSETGAVEIVAPVQITGIKGNNGIIDGVILNDRQELLKADRVLFCYGLKMHLGPILGWNIELQKNRIKVNPRTYETNLTGVYAAGDIAFYEGKLKLILTGFAEIAAALHNAHLRVFPDKVLRFQYSTEKGVPDGV